MRVFLEVIGESDFSASVFEDNYDAQREYIKMIQEDITDKKIIDKELDEIFYLQIHEFSNIDDKFIELARDVWSDSDTMKCHNIFEVNYFE